MSGERTYHARLVIGMGGIYDEPCAIEARFDRSAIPVVAAVDHHVSQSPFLLQDPDAIEVELDVDNPHHHWHRPVGQTCYPISRPSAPGEFSTPGRHLMLGGVR